MTATPAPRPATDGALALPLEPAPALPVFVMHGLPGFPTQHHYLLEPVAEARYWLRAEEGHGPDFAVIEPHRFIPDFQPDLPAPVARQLGARDAAELKVLAIVTLPRVPGAAPTVNLQGLLVLNEGRGLARQVILPDSPFGVRTPLPVQ